MKTERTGSPGKASVGQAEGNALVKLQAICLLILTAIGVAIALDWLESIVVPFVLALFLAVILTPLIEFLMVKLRISRGLAVVVTFVLGFVVLTFFGGVVTASVAQLASDAGAYQEQVEGMVNKAIEKVPLEWFGVERGTDFDLSALIPAGTTKALLGRLAGSIVSISSKTVLVMMFLAFLLLGAAKRQARRDLRGEIETRVRKYVITKSLLSLLTGFLVFLVLQMCGIGYAVAFGAFAFALNFIPNVGSIVACMLPIPVVLLTPDISTTRIVLAIALPAAVQLGIGNVLEPKIMGQSLDMHPVTVLLSLMFWGMIWGVAGMFLAVPMTAVMKIVMERIELTAPVAALLAGHPMKEAAKHAGGQ